MNILLNLLSVVVIFVCGILIMIYGWGLTPASWGWIIFGNIFTVVVASVLQVAAKRID
jgi:hypothetical protein